jgi:hypothetical protein
MWSWLRAAPGVIRITAKASVLGRLRMVRFSWVSRLSRRTLRAARVKFRVTIRCRGWSFYAVSGVKALGMATSGYGLSRQTPVGDPQV